MHALSNFILIALTAHTFIPDLHRDSVLASRKDRSYRQDGEVDKHQPPSRDDSMRPISIELELEKRSGSSAAAAGMTVSLNTPNVVRSFLNPAAKTPTNRQPEVVIVLRNNMAPKPSLVGW
ncbi:uncharacterized protein Z519_09724 [Cladophialophora bantiana CBS 173.52]|uniref:Uncharacterized protein n=1 Tax=Cladophialophora bantiana (strain ATCC 10958 / CBS 173.52 / CDC B-1940 / NIH 8579) TaxID=1442370 RepID=A0A0D2H8L4_CLAB1|nr:uncharacterized protein Z519_09724 [Cladophialophora bantiana CBS 173.52]KIW89568.1 hypothetical protein Z519_09724 [Cladophialophora bantiana CBS 173.52]